MWLLQRREQAPALRWDGIKTGRQYIFVCVTAGGGTPPLRLKRKKGGNPPFLLMPKFEAPSQGYCRPYPSRGRANFEQKSSLLLRRRTTRTSRSESAIEKGRIFRPFLIMPKFEARLRNRNSVQQAHPSLPIPRWQDRRRWCARPALPSFPAARPPGCRRGRS